MSDTRIVPVDQAARTYATDPRHHVVLEASAGTGKTRVLVDRYLALLAAGVDPRHVLAITFTRKAAAEMRERILTELRLAHPGVWQGLRDRADDIAVSTIDAFCFSLLREFPLEAGLDPGFTLADETEIARLVEMALDRTLRECRQRAAHDESIRLVFAQLPLTRLAQGLRALLERRFVAPAALRRFLGRHAREVRSEAAAAAAVRADLRRTLDGLPGGLAPLLASGPAGAPLWDLCRLDIERLVGDSEMAPADVRAAVDGLSRWALTRAGEPRKRSAMPARAYASSAQHETHVRLLAPFGEAVAAVRRRFDAALNVLLARGMRRIFRIAHRRYLETLLLHDALDFSEVLARAVALLSRMDEFSRSRFRLEARYQHVLVDEFQDTSRLQWALVASLVRSWGEGAGLGHEGVLPPSIFLVGDRKQSIYRFRDADVGLLDEAVTFVRALADDDAPVRQAISQSFRSHSDLLAFANDLAFSLVERVAPEAAAFRYGSDDHFPLPAVAAGPGASTPRLAMLAGPDVDACAAGVAAEIERLLQDGLVTDRDGSGPRRTRPGDIAVLFRSRESHREFERALSARRIPSYVYKGLGFYDSDEIKDLVALVRALAAPESHLRAAAVLRSELVGISDDALRRLAPDLAPRLSSAGPGEEALSPDDAGALARLRASWPGWCALVDRLPPAAVLDHVIESSAYACTWRGHRQQQARENVKKFRALIRRIQNRGYATMARVAAHIDRLSAGDESNAAIDAADAVNLMTIHASKGLEFPIVFLVNVTRGTGGFPPPLRVVPDAADDQPLVGVARYEPAATRAEQAHDREESKRLLYVAVTRAREYLYLSAAPQKQGRMAALPGSLASVCPSALVDALGLALTGVPAVTWQGASRLHTFRVCPASIGAPDVTTASEQVPMTTDVPPSLEPLPPSRTVDRGRVTDLARGGPLPRASSSTTAPLDADLVLGRAVHRLLARGPAAAGERLLTDDVDLLDAEERDAVADWPSFVADAHALVESVWSDPALCDVLGSPAARFEVPIVLRHEEAGGVRLVRGTIDCLVPLADRVMVFELKTGRPHEAHRRQLALYVDAVRHSLPGARVEGLLVYASRRRQPPPTAARLPFDESETVTTDR